MSRPTVGGRVRLDDNSEATIVTVRPEVRDGQQVWRLRVQPDDAARPPRWIKPLVSHAKS